MPEKANVAYAILGTVHNEELTGHRLAISHKRGGRAVVVVYGVDGKRIRTVMYRRLERVEVTYGGSPAGDLPAGDDTELRRAATRVVQLATRNQVIATHAATAELRRVLDGSPEVAE
jgi:hypothetical protein